MAGVFSPQFQGDVSYERPVETPSALGALANLAGFFVGEYGDKLARDAKAASTRSSKIDPNLAVFQQGIERVQAIRDQKGETAGLIAERQLAQNFANAGIDFDTSYQNVYKNTTGREWAGYGRDTESFMREEALKDPQVQASFIASYALLPQDADEEQRLEYALGQKATLQASADIIARSKAEGGIRWNNQTESAYGQAIDTFLNTNLGALVSSSKAGARVGPQGLANMKASWGQLKVNISRPSNVSDDQWKATQDKINNIDSMFTNLEKAASSEVLFEEITTGLANALIKAGDGSTVSVLAAMTAIKDPASFKNLSGFGGKVDELIMEVGNGLNLNITQSQLFSHILEQPNAPVEGGVVTLDSLPPAIASRVEGLSPQQYYNGLKASGKLASLVDQNSLQRPEGRQQFVENAAGIGAVLMSMENDQFLSPAFLKELVGNPQFMRNVKSLEGVDAEGAAVVKSYLVSGLNTERVRQERNLSSLEGLANSASWNGQTYVVNRQALSERAPAMRIQDFEKSLTRYYGGDLVAAARDGFKRMSDVTDVTQVGGFFNIEQAMLRRDALSTIKGVVGGLDTATAAASQTTETTQAISNGPIATKLGLDFEGLEGQYGLPTGYLERTAQLESSGNPNARNTESSAGGLFQQINSNAKQYGVTDRFDPKQSAEGAAKFARDNLVQLRRALGREPTAAELYLAHQQGGGGASKLLANQTELAVNVVGRDAVIKNGGNVNMTAGEFANIWISKYTGGRGATSFAQATGGGQVQAAAATDTQTAEVAAGGGLDVGGVIQTAAPEVVAADATLPEAPVQEAAQPTQQARTAPTAAQAPSAEVQAALATLAGSGTAIPVFTSQADYEAAVQAGEVTSQFAVVNGKIVAVGA